MKKKIIIALVILASLTFLSVGTVLIVTRIAEKQIEELINTPIDQIDFLELTDGIYNGEVKTIPIHIIVKVTIEDHQIVDIEIIKHRHGQGRNAESIINDVLVNQSLDIDLISGATYSSKAFIIAIHNALKGSLND